jgi:hypothetical protein
MEALNTINMSSVCNAVYSGRISPTQSRDLPPPS